MPSSMNARRLLAESVPAAVVLLFWNLLATVGDGVVGTGLRLAGAVLALLYVAVRGRQMGGTLSAESQPIGAKPVLRESATVSLAAGVWFLASLVTSAPVPTSIEFIRVTIQSLSIGFASTGVVTVVLYAVAVGPARLQTGTDSRPAAEADGGD